MKKQDILSLLQLLLVPVLLVLLGLILLVNPDAASAMISRIIGYAFILAATGTGLTAVFSSTGKIPKGILAVMLAVFGGWLVAMVPALLLFTIDSLPVYPVLLADLAVLLAAISALDHWLRTRGIRIYQTL